MGMCKQCGKVFNSLEMNQGYCKECKTDDLLENDKKKFNELSKKKAVDNILFTVIMISLLVFSMGYLIANFKNPNQISASKSQEQVTRDLLHSQFSTWDGSHPALVEKVKSAMNNPDSFEHVETRFGWLDESKNSAGDVIAVVMKYRGTNAFGGVVTEEVVARVNTSGNVIEISR